MRAVLIFLAWFALAPPAFAQMESDLYIISVGGSPDAPRDVAMADAARIGEGANGYRRLWTWTYFTQEANPEVRSLVMLSEFDCARGRYRLLQVTGRSWSGERDTFTPSDQWEYASPQSNGDRMLTFACSNAQAIATGNLGHLGNINPDEAAAGILRLSED